MAVRLLSYPQEAREAWESQGGYPPEVPLAAWIKIAYEHLATRRRPTFGADAFALTLKPPRPPEAGPVVLPQLDRGDRDWHELRRYYGFLGWIYLASREPAIQARYGRSDRFLDEAGFLLSEETRHFLNYLTRTYPGIEDFDPAAVAQQFKVDLGSETETYEFGSLLYLLTLDAAAPDVIPLGPRMELRRAQGPWADARFEGISDLRHPLWAVAVTHTRDRSPLRAASTQLLSDDQAVERVLFARALLPLRLVRPELVLVESPEYRIGMSAYWRPPDRETLLKDLLERWRRPGRERWRKPLTRREVQELELIGAALRDTTTIAQILAPPPEPSRYELVLSEFLEAFSRLQWQDIAVDLVVTLEAMLGGGEDEITHKIAMRYALLFGVSPGESRRLFRTVKHIYGLRSGLVHASPGKTASALAAIIKEWRDLKQAPPKKDVAGNSAPAAGIIQRVCSEAVRAMVHLGGEAVQDQTFPGWVDELAFDPKSRRALQKRLRVSKTRLAPRP